MHNRIEQLQREIDHALQSIRVYWPLRRHWISRAMLAMRIGQIRTARKEIADLIAGSAWATVPQWATDEMSEETLNLLWQNGQLRKV